jgi:two-component system, OmpR family, response regulator
MVPTVETSMRILLVEDEMEVANSISRKLGGSNFAADHASSIREARAALSDIPYALVVLDRRLPDGDGLSFIPEMRRMQPGVRVLMLSAYDETDEVVAGLEAGADDYMTKPFKFAELMARIRAGLRRPGGDSLPAIVVGDLAFSPQIRDVSVHGKSVVLHRRELMLLEALMRRAERMVSRQTLIDEIYGFSEDANPKILNLLVLRLRKRLEELDAGVKIHTARGIGYMIAKARA